MVIIFIKIFNAALKIRFDTQVAQGDKLKRSQTFLGTRGVDLWVKIRLTDHVSFLRKKTYLGRAKVGPSPL